MIYSIFRNNHYIQWFLVGVIVCRPCHCVKEKCFFVARAKSVGLGGQIEKFCGFAGQNFVLLSGDRKLTK